MTSIGHRKASLLQHKENLVMQHNVGSLDRTLRVLVGIGLLSLLVLADAPLRWFGLIGLVPLATAAMSSCPLYQVFGISTCSAAKPRG
jgi:hypothetical protein